MVITSSMTAKHTENGGIGINSCHGYSKTVGFLHMLTRMCAQRHVPAPVLLAHACGHARPCRENLRYDIHSIPATRDKDCQAPGTPGYLSFTLWLSVLCMHSNAWLATRMSLQLARLPRTGSSAQHSRRLRSTRVAAPGLLAHAEVKKHNIYFSRGPKRRYSTVSMLRTC
jgi:hypothetical protein